MRKEPLIAFLVALFVVASGCLNSNDQSEKNTVVEVQDGDTVIMSDGTIVRLLGVNTPERGMPYYDEATELLADLVLGQVPVLIADSLSPDTGDNDRLLRHIENEDGLLVNYQLIKQGMAIWYPYEDGTDKDQSYEQGEEIAARDEVGLWAPSPHQVIIRYIDYDPDSGQGNETVEIENVGGTAIQLEGWYLQDEASRTHYNFPNVTLDSGSVIRIHSGEGTDSDTDLFWGWYQGIWNNNGGDLALLQDEEGLMVDYYCYDYPSRLDGHCV